MSQSRSELLHCLARDAYMYRPDDPFVLASGRTSAEYLDCRRVLSHPQALVLTGTLVYQALLPEVSAVGGLTMGADPVAMAASYASADQARAISWFRIRKERKEHGRGRLLEGDVSPGSRIALVDDVVTSGQSTLQAYKACIDEGLQVAQVILLVDREEKGMQAIAKGIGSDVPLCALFHKSEIHQAWQQQQASV